MTIQSEREPTTQEVQNPMMKSQGLSVKGELKELCQACHPSSIVPPKIAGIANKKENWRALSLDQPSIRAAEIVVPLLEMPGKMAMAWKRPMVKASPHLLARSWDCRGKRT